MTLVKKLFILFLFISFSSTVSGQSSGKKNYDRNNPLKKKPGIGLGGGATYFLGDMGSKAKGAFRPATTLKLDYRLNRSFAIELNIGAGKLAERYQGQLASNDFESNITFSHLNMRFHFDRIFNLEPSAITSPFLTTGIGFMLFESYVNIKDKNGDTYQFHKDGLITNIDGEEISRDAEFETPINEDKNYANNTPVFPVGGGVKFYFSEHIELIAEGILFFTTHDHIEGYAGYYKDDEDNWQRKDTNTNNDTFFYSSLTFIYNLGYSDNRAQRFVPPIIR
ncbi:MAG: hypothetical protein ACQESM_06425 [Bacteroidota bacterium]